MAADGFDDYADLRDRSRVFRDGLRRRTETVVRLVREGRDTADEAAFALLDVGTADGRMLGAMRKAFPNCDAVGVEASDELVAVARAAGLEVVQARAEDLPFPDGRFDVVTLVATLKHVPDADRALVEAARVLKPQGLLVVADPTPFGLRLGLRRGHFDPRWLAHRWSLATTRDHLDRAGFEVVRGVRYMPLPIDLRWLRWIEPLGRAIGVSRLFLQQATLARRRPMGRGS